MRAFIIFRDRVTYASKCLAALEAAGLDVMIVDHGTTWQPAQDWLRELRKNTGVSVVDMGPGHHPRDLWNNAWFRHMNARDRYIVTDPDVVPSEDCPLDWPEHLSGVMDRFPSYHKIGMGLRIDRIPEHCAYRQEVLDWEAQFWKTRLGDEEVYHGDVDTTLAIHVPIQEMGTHSFSGVRTGFPYVDDHLAWYEKTGDLTEEQQYYHDHSEPNISFWTATGRAWEVSG